MDKLNILSSLESEFRGKVLGLVERLSIPGAIALNVETIIYEEFIRAAARPLAAEFALRVAADQRKLATNKSENG